MNRFIQEVRNRPHDSDRDIAACAQDLLDHCGVDASREEVPVVHIMEELGIGVYQNRVMPMKAYIAVNADFMEKFGTTKIACVSMEIPYGRKRFILAHELAHYLFDYDEGAESEYYHIYTGKKTHMEDRRADVFAASLLMPEQAFRGRYQVLMKETGSMPDTCAGLAEHFGMEVRTVKARLKEMNKE